MKSPTFLEQFDKITRAYFEDSLRPFSPCACFIGNLLNNNTNWNNLRHYCFDEYVPSYPNLLDPVFYFYTMEEICLMETNFLNKYMDRGGRFSEESLYYAMDTTLDILRYIHESRGEVIDQPKVFSKRQKLQIA